MVAEQSDYAEGLCVLGMADAALGHKDEAIREGRRAVELMPVSKDAIRGPLLIQYLAVIYAWTGEKDLALEQLSVAARIPSHLSYGHLRLHPYWDPLRGDLRFEKIVADLDCRCTSRRRKAVHVRANEKLATFVELESAIRMASQS